jgi:hypothetical protein
VTHVGHRRTGNTVTGIPLKCSGGHAATADRSRGPWRKHEEPLAEDHCTVLARSGTWIARRPCGTPAFQLHIAPRPFLSFRVATPQRSLPKRKVDCIRARKCTNEYQRSLLSLSFCGLFFFKRRSTPGCTMCAPSG